MSKGTQLGTSRAGSKADLDFWLARGGDQPEGALYCFEARWPQSQVVSSRFLLITFCPILLKIQGRFGSGLEKHLSDPLERKRER